VLQDVFPQVDPRALRAVAIEHYKDADAAVEVVLVEVIPFLPQKPKPIVISDESESSVTPSEVIVIDSDGAVVGSDDAVRADSARLNESVDSTSHEAVVVNSDDAVHVDSTRLNESVDTNSHEAVVVNKEEQSDNITNAELISAEKLEANNAASVEESANVELVIFDLENGADSNGQPSLQMENFTTELSPSSTELPNGHENTPPLADVENKSTVNDNVVNRSGQSCSIDLLDEIIEDARSNKKTLMSAMELVINMMKEVETQEKAAEKAKEEAAQGGLHIFRKVEELKHQLRLAKEANDMHSGEVYGEKAILATEMRELQTRLLGLSVQRDSSLAVLDEMRKTLELRLSVAENETKAAEKEKQDKEENINNMLNNQKRIMEKVVEEAKILEQAAEENAKLRDFLVDRGHMVDVLQGEINVKCQDVQLLKERFDEQVPLSKFLSRSRSSSILASSISSSRSNETAEQVTAKLIKSSEEKKNDDYDEDVRQFAAEGEKEIKYNAIPADDGWELFTNEKSSANYTKPLSDDGWELFESRI
jgi:hypothetical protein